MFLYAHLCDLGRVLKDCSSCLGQMVQAGVASQGLGQGFHGADLVPPEKRIRLKKEYITCQS